MSFYHSTKARVEDRAIHSLDINGASAIGQDSKYLLSLH